MQKLGLPETPDKYDFGKPGEGEPAFDEAYLGWARGAFHKVGLPVNVAKELTAEHNAFIKETIARQKTDYEAQVTADKASLLKEWGNGHERQMNVAKAAAQALGFDAALIDAMETQKGYAGTWKFLAGLGAKLSEDGFVGAEGSGGTKNFGGMLTPAEAKAAYDQKLLDPNFKAALLDRMHPGHKGAVAEQQKYYAIMYPG